MALLNRQSRSRVNSRSLHSFIKKAAQVLRRREDDFSVTLVDDRVMRTLNWRFRHTNQTTDVLSFPGRMDAQSWPRASGEAIPSLGEIVISLPMARRQARREGHSLEEEIKLLILHGLLHLLGYDHETDDGEMNREEYRLRGKLI